MKEVTIPDLIADLQTRPRPVLFLDTCDILDTIQGLAEGNAGKLRWSNRMLTGMASRNPPIQPVVSFLVAHEWNQNCSQIEADARKSLQRLNRAIEDVYDAFRLVNQPIPAPLPVPWPSDAIMSIEQHLRGRATMIMAACAIIARDDICMESAIQRVLNRRRPSHKRALNDSINLEHYLEFTRQFRRAGLTNPCIFASGNTADYCNPGKPGGLHDDLTGEFQSAGLEFVPDPNQALTRLLII